MLLFGTIWVFWAFYAVLWQIWSVVIYSLFRVKYFWLKPCLCKKKSGLFACLILLLSLLYLCLPSSWYLDSQAISLTVSAHSDWPVCKAGTPRVLPGTLPIQLFQFRGHYHPGHHWLVPLSFAVHLDLTLVVVNVLALRAQPREGLAVHLCQSELKGSIIGWWLARCLAKLFSLSIRPIATTYKNQ